MKAALLDRFLKFISFDTQSDEEADHTPSSPGQMIFAEYLKDHLIECGFSEVELDSRGYLYATVPATTDIQLPVIGFIAHMDTSPDMPGRNVKARIVNNYDGADITLSREDSIILSPASSPELLRHKGEDLIVTDGHTLLGADDKAGIAEIITAMEYLMAHPEIKHGKIRVAFNPDEEIGLGAHKFDIERFGCDWAYTIDGGEVGELEYENFNAASAHLTFRGLNVHPGSAKDKMRNSITTAREFADMLNPAEVPEKTEGREGFFHLISFNGSVEKTELTYIIRDHDREKFEDRKEIIKALASQINDEYGKGTVELSMEDQYHNMREKIDPVIHIVELAREAMLEAGIKPEESPIRGGTDGAQLSFMGLPCPNIFAGGLNMHGRYEFIPVQSMIKAAEVIVNICRLPAE